MEERQAYIIVLSYVIAVAYILLLFIITLLTAVGVSDYTNLNNCPENFYNCNSRNPNVNQQKSVCMNNFTTTPCEINFMTNCNAINICIKDAVYANSIQDQNTKNRDLSN